MPIITLEIEIPDELMAKNIIEIFSKGLGWDDSMPIDALDFAKAQIKNYIKESAKDGFIKNALEVVKEVKEKEFEDAFNT